jgi:hypothetical protein
MVRLLGSKSNATIKNKFRPPEPLPPAQIVYITAVI